MDSSQELGNMGILALMLTRGLSILPGMVVSILLVDIATSFDVQVGVAGQIKTVSGILSVMFSLVMGVLSVKYRHKSLLSIGLLLYIVSAVFSFYSTSLAMLVGVYSLVGVATSLTIPMVNSIIGEFVPSEMRTKVIGRTIAGLSATYMLGSLAVGYISEVGWKMTMLIVVVPVCVLTCLTCLFYIPESNQESRKISASGLLSGYRNLIKNKSAIGCVLGNILGISAWNLYSAYGASFWRQKYALSTGTISVAMIFIMLGYIGGSLSASRFVKRLGVKTVVLASTGVVGVVTLFTFNSPTFLISYLLTIIACFSAGVRVTSSSSFSLAQMPEYRGTMMSLHSAGASLGTTIAVSFGGLLLLRYGYSVCATVLGVFALLGALVYQFMTTKIS